MSLPIRARLTAWYSALTMAVLLAGAAVTLIVQARAGREQLDAELARVLATVESVMRHEFSEGMPLAAAAAEASSEVSAPGVRIRLRRADGGELVAWGDLLPDLPQGLAGRAEPLIEGIRYRRQQRAIDNVAEPFAVEVLGSLAPLERQQRALRRALAAGLIVALVVAAAGGWLVGGRALRPLTRMAHEATGITVRSEQIRLTIPHPQDELGQLGRAFNALLERLAGALHGQRQFMADASHQMRTPVSVLRTTAQVMLRKPARDEREYRDSLTIVGEQAARLSRLVDAMFLLARAEAGGLEVRRDAIYLDELVDECTRAVAVLAAERGIQVRTEGDADVAFAGDDELLRHMIVNLLENAVRHTPAGGTVRASLTQHDEEVTLRVFDQGEGVSATDRERIFERFVTLDGRPGGAGLGLPMARWVAERHGGALTLEASGPGGSCFAVRLPTMVPAVVPGGEALV